MEIEILSSSSTTHLKRLVKEWGSENRGKVDVIDCDLSTCTIKDQICYTYCITFTRDDIGHIDLNAVIATKQRKEILEDMNA